MDFILTTKDYLIKESIVNEDKIIYMNEKYITNVRFDEKECKYIYEINGEQKEYKVDEWKPILNEDNYVVSRYGQVKNVKKGTLLKPYHYDYSRVCIRRSNNQHFVHKLVLPAFIGVDDNPERNEVNHNDFNTSNNSLFNLHWVTHKENLYHYRAKHNLFFDYEGTIGKEVKSNYGKCVVVGYNKENYTLLVEFENTGNQKYITLSAYRRGGIVDNFYIITNSNGEEIKTRKLNVIKEVTSGRFSEILLGQRSHYKGYTVRRDTNNKVLLNK